MSFQLSRSARRLAAAAAVVSCLFFAAAHAQQITPSAAMQINALKDVKASQSAVERKLSSRLNLARLHARSDQRLATLTGFRFVEPERDGRVAVEIVIQDRGGMKAVLERLERIGAPVTSRNLAHPRVHARLRLDDLIDVAAMPQVRRIAQPARGVAQAVNQSQGDATHAAQTARGIYSTTGTGVKVCVLADGVDSLAAVIGSDDLPAVEVLAGQAGAGDEGTAMLEVIHDLAPGATLAFATALPDLPTFAQNILDLAAGGCNIVVDDFVYADESPFQDGIVAQAVDTVTAAGVVYLSAAGNAGNVDDGTASTWEGDFLANGTPASLAGGGLAHNFGDGGQSLLVEAGGPTATAVLTWAEHYDTAVGAASTDFDLYVLNADLSQIFDAGTDVQDGVGGDDFPIESFSVVNPGERLVVLKFADGATSSTPMFNLWLINGEIDIARATPGATRGHGTAAGSISVAATPAGAAFPGVFDATDESSTYSSDGPRRILLSPTGTELTPGNRTSTGGVVRQKPELTAATGVATATPGFASFEGTSASAAHAAAIAALIKQAVPAATPAQVRTAMLAGSIDIEAPGTDRNTGAGIVMAPASLAAAGAGSVAFLEDLAPVTAQLVGDGDGAVEPNEDWALSLPLTNSGGMNATAITATITSATPGVVITRGSATYPDLAPGADASPGTPFAFFIEPGTACGSLLEFEITVAYDGGATPTQQFVQSIQLGALSAPIVTSYSGAAVGIPDAADLSGNSPGAPANATLNVAGAGPLARVSLSIDGTVCSAGIGSTTVGLDHTFVNDLEIALVGPDATSVMVIDETDGSGNNLCQVTLDDQSAGASIQTVTSAQAPFTGSWLPANSLFDAFGGKSANGDWSLRVQDFFSGDTGSIRAWTLTVTPAVCDAPPQAVVLTAAKTVTGDFVPGGAVEYSIVVTNTGNGLQLDNSGDELTDALPAGLVAGVPTATSGTAAAAGNTVTWNGSLAPGEQVTLTIPATVAAGTGGDTIANQATLSYDNVREGSNDTTAPSDDPSTQAAGDATAFTVGEGLLTITPAARDFGDVAVGSASAIQTVTLANAGNADLEVIAITIAAAPFARVADTCPDTEPFTLAPNAECTLAFTFTPIATGAANQPITVSANAPGGGDITLTGNGLAPGALQVSPATVDFGDTLPFQAVEEVVTFTNTGQVALQITSFGAPTTPFLSLGGTCSGPTPRTLAPAESCEIEYQFAPTTPGASTQSITIANSAGDIQITLTGNAVIGEVTVAPTTLDFGDVAVGTTSPEQSFTLTNTGGGELQLNGITGQQLPFTRSGGTCAMAGPFTLAAGASCTAAYTYAPSAAIDSTQMVSVIPSNGAIAGATVTLTGSGQQTAATLGSSSLDLGSVPVGQGGAAYEQGVSISNTGSQPIQVTAIGAVAAPFYYAGSTCPPLPFTLQPGTSCILGYGIAPTSPGAFSALATIETSAGTLSLTLLGDGIVVAPSQPATIPTLSSPGTLLAIALLALVGLIGVRRRG